MIVTNYNAQGEEIKLEEIELSDELNERILQIIKKSEEREDESKTRG